MYFWSFCSSFANTPTLPAKHPRGVAPGAAAPAVLAPVNRSDMKKNTHSGFFRFPGGGLGKPRWDGALRSSGAIKGLC